MTIRIVWLYWTLKKCMQMIDSRLLPNFFSNMDTCFPFFSYDFFFSNLVSN
ncbi:hypothetical protein HanIR_Chr17g0898021 [Helianthus annuus]|nr:hypothetical protein HanIR_Chr17g0898021 [Helianthus annuus]